MPGSWEEIRDDFPALERYVYLDSAAGAPTPRPVAEAVAAFYRELEEDGSVVHWPRWMERRAAVRAEAARLIGAEADEIAFVPNTSTGMNLIADLVGPEGAVLTDELEFPSVTLPFIHRKIPVHFVPAVEGQVRLESFAVAHAPKASTIAVSHVQFSNGYRMDLKALGGIKAHRHLVVSGSQSIGAFPLDVRACGVDALATAGHKWLCAGYGTGFCYVSRALLDRFPPRAIGWMSVEHPFAFDNRQFRVLPSNERTEVGCPPFPQIFALGAALDYLAGIGIEAVAERILSLNAYLTLRLEREGFVVLSPGGTYRSGETLCEVEDPRRATAFLRALGILVSRKPQGIRISTHYFNTEHEIDRCVEGLAEYRKAL